MLWAFCFVSGLLYDREEAVWIKVFSCLMLVQEASEMNWFNA